MPTSSHNRSRPVTQYQRLAASLVVRSRQLLEDGPTMLPYDMPAMYRIWVRRIVTIVEYSCRPSQCVIAEGIGSKAAYGLAVSDELRPFREVLSLADAYFEVEWGGSFTVPPFNLIGSNASPFAENIFWDVDSPGSRSLSIQSSAALPRENNTIGREPLFSYGTYQFPLRSFLISERYSVTDIYEGELPHAQSCQVSFRGPHAIRHRIESIF